MVQRAIAVRTHLVNGLFADLLQLNCEIFALNCVNCVVHAQRLLNRSYPYQLVDLTSKFQTLRVKRQAI